MRLSNRLLGNAATTYLRLMTTFALGLFTTWYILGKAGVIGFGLIALSTSANGVSRSLERALRFGLVRELAAAIATGDATAIRRAVTSAFTLCLRSSVPLIAFVAVLVTAAQTGFFNTPASVPGIDLALVVLILGEGTHAVLRLLGAPFLQSLFAAQRIDLDNLLMVVARATHALSAVLVFGVLLPHAALADQLMAFALTRATVQLADVALGIWLAKWILPGLRLERAAYDEGEYLAIRSTVWHSAHVALLFNNIPSFLAIVINLFFGLAFNSIWQIVVQFSGFARMASEGLLRGIDALSTHLQQDGKEATVLDLSVRSIRYQLAVVFPAALFLGLFARPILGLWVGHRLAMDPRLAAGGLTVAGALVLAATMAQILLVAQVLRAGFFGVERALYGLGAVSSYAWFAKWGTLMSLTLAVGCTAISPEPILSPIALLASTVLFSPIVVLRAARREMGMDIGSALRRSLPRPLIAGTIFFAALLPVRLAFDSLTPVGMILLLLLAAAVYTPVAAVVLPERDERRRVVELVRQGFAWILRTRRRDPSPGN